MAGDFDKKVLKTEFGTNFHVRYPIVFKQQKDDLVLVKRRLPVARGTGAFARTAHILRERLISSRGEPYDSTGT